LITGRDADFPAHGERTAIGANRSDTFPGTYAGGGLSHLSQPVGGHHGLGIEAVRRQQLGE
jgi:hypothetical protein